MNKYLSIFTALIFTGVNTFAQQSEKKINIGLVPPLSSNWKTASRDTNSFSLNLIAGVSASETGFAIAGFGNFVRHSADGVIIAGALNTANSVHGFEVAGFGNFVRNKVDGVIIAGFMNTANSQQGLEVAGFGNFAKTGSHTQIAGFMNIGGNVSALQIAGFTNVANNVKGTQIGGFMNVAKNVKGTQISGFINIADTADCQVGIINISKNGEKSVGAMVDENRTILLNLRTGGKFLYGIIGIGYNVANKKDVYAYQAGLGAHLIKAEPFRLNAELTNTSLLNFKGLDYYKAAFAMLPSINLGNRVDLFAGPSFVYLQTNSSEDILRHKKYISSWGGKNGDDFNGFYIGYNAGIAIRL